MEQTIETVVHCRCLSKKEAVNYHATLPIAWTMELDVPYDTNNIYWKMSGGSNFILNTVNKEAADMFEVGKTYSVSISPAPVDFGDQKEA